VHIPSPSDIQLFHAFGRACVYAMRLAGLWSTFYVLEVVVQWWQPTALIPSGVWSRTKWTRFRFFFALFSVFSFPFGGERKRKCENAKTANWGTKKASKTEFTHDRKDRRLQTVDCKRPRMYWTTRKWQIQLTTDTRTHYIALSATGTADTQ
jgi:hypothetical protein